MRRASVPNETTSLTLQRFSVASSNGSSLPREDPSSHQGSDPGSYAVLLMRILTIDSDSLTNRCTRRLAGIALHWYQDPQTQKTVTPIDLAETLRHVGLLSAGYVGLMVQIICGSALNPEAAVFRSRRILMIKVLMM